jgi:4-hydroxybenzoate polyprenyltransferase
MVTLSPVVVGSPTWRGVSRPLWLCIMEARPIVLAVIAMRFLVGVALAYPGAGPIAIWRIPLALLTWLLANASVYLFDGVMDVAEDRLNGSSRPIARGALTRPFALATTVVSAGLATIGALVLGPPYGLLVPVLLVLGYAYTGPGLRLKRWSPATGTIVLLAGLLTFGAGGATTSFSISTSMTLLAFAVAMSCWMGFVGAVAKDFSDVRGDTLTGRRTWVVVKGVRRAGRRLSGNALLVAGGFAAAALLVDDVLLWPATVVLLGAITIALTCRSGSARSGSRRPYRQFMVTQYAAHAVVLVAIVWP